MRAWTAAFTSKKLSGSTGDAWKRMVAAPVAQAVLARWCATQWCSRTARTCRVLPKPLALYVSPQPRCDGHTRVLRGREVQQAAPARAQVVVEQPLELRLAEQEVVGGLGHPGAPLRSRGRHRGNKVGMRIEAAADGALVEADTDALHTLWSRSNRGGTRTTSLTASS